jgi:hypothetical protein
MDKKDTPAEKIKLEVVIMQAREGYQPKEDATLAGFQATNSDKDKIERGFQPKPSETSSDKPKPPSGGSNVTPPKKSES